jgi:hypothetical protein
MTRQFSCQSYPSSTCGASFALAAQRYRASGLILLAAAIILWNTVYLQRAVDHLRKQGIEPGPDDLAHLSPLGWEHINLTGDYAWEVEETLNPDQFRPLRTRASELPMAVQRALDSVSCLALWRRSRLAHPRG